MKMICAANDYAFPTSHTVSLFGVVCIWRQSFNFALTPSLALNLIGFYPAVCYVVLLYKYTDLAGHVNIFIVLTYKVQV